jgi:hypothetical protein
MRFERESPRSPPGSLSVAGPASLFLAFQPPRAVGYRCDVRRRRLGGRRYVAEPLRRR